MMPHPIRLRHPWDELPAVAPGKVAYRRRFNRPTGLGAHEIVTLEVDRIVFRGEDFAERLGAGRTRAGGVLFGGHYGAFEG